MAQIPMFPDYFFRLPTSVKTASSGRSNWAMPLVAGMVPAFTQSTERVVMYRSHDSTMRARGSADLDVFRAALFHAHQHHRAGASVVKRRQR